MNRRVLAAVAALLLAAVGTALLIIYVQTAEERALAGEELVDVLVLEEAVAAGTDASALTELVREEQVPVKVQASGSVASLDALAGLVAAVDLLPGEQLVSTRFVEPAVFAQIEEVDIPEGLQVITVPLDPARAVGGQIVPGDTVGVVASFEQAEVPDEEDPTETTPFQDTSGLILHKILVTNVQGEQTPAQPDEEPARDRGGQPRPPGPPAQLLVSLAMDAPSAERVAFAAEHGTVWLTLQPEDATEDGTRTQTRETIYQ